MPIRGNPRSYQKKFLFVVEIEGVESAAFQSCSELSAEVAVIEQWEGGRQTPDKSPGRTSVSDITLERGATDDLDLFEWFKEVIAIGANAGLVDNLYKRDMEIILLNRDGSVRRRWSVTGAWPTKFMAGEWDNDADENVIESVTLAIDGFDVV